MTTGFAVNRRSVGVLIVGFLAIASLDLAAQTMTWNSPAEVWFYKSPNEKRIYLEGFCEGTKGFSTNELKLDWLTCTMTIPEAGTNRAKFFRFCGIASLDDAREAVQYLDEFFSDENHSDIPVWAAAVAYNDRVCDEKNAQERLSKLQAEWKCRRQLGLMIQSDVSKSFLDKKSEECLSYR